MHRPVIPRPWRQTARWAALVAGAVPLLAFPAPDVSVVAWFGLVPGLLVIRAAPSARVAGGSDLLSVALGLTQMAGNFDRA